tara:strand:- start:756 stop:857 length:102 start_codon:yes stop_codon:yes gene_type:complete
VNGSSAIHRSAAAASGQSTMKIEPMRVSPSALK